MSVCGIPYYYRNLLRRTVDFSGLFTYFFILVNMVQTFNNCCTPGGLTVLNVRLFFACAFTRQCCLPLSILNPSWVITVCCCLQMLKHWSFYMLWCYAWWTTINLTSISFQLSSEHDFWINLTIQRQNVIVMIVDVSITAKSNSDISIFLKFVICWLYRYSMWQFEVMFLKVVPIPQQSHWVFVKNTEKLHVIMLIMHLRWLGMKAEVCHLLLARMKLCCLLKFSVTKKHVMENSMRWSIDRLFLLSVQMY